MTELFVVGVVVLILYGVVRGLASLISGVGGRRFRAYRHLAHRYKGRYENRGFNEPPTVSFPYNGSTVRVGLAPNVPGQILGPRTRVVTRFREGKPFRMELAPVSRALPAQPPRGTKSVRIGDNEFDRRFNIQANDAEMARQFLMPAVQNALANLLRLSPQGGMLLSINPERLLVQVDRNLGQYPDALFAVVRESLALHDGLEEGISRCLREGIDVVEVGQTLPEDGGPPICKVCGETIESGPRTCCGTCRAPFHRDCWEFIGACSVFGCSGKIGVHQDH